MARGGFRVSAEWKDGRVVRCEVSGEAGKPMRVKIGDAVIEAVGTYVYEGETL